MEMPQVVEGSFDQLYAQPAQVAEPASWRRAALVMSMLAPEDREIISASLPDDLHLRLDCLSSEVSPVVHALPLDDLLLALGGGPSSHTPDSAASAQASTWLEDLSGQELMVTLRQEGPTWGALLGFALSTQRQIRVWRDLSPVERRLWSEQIGNWHVHPARQLLLDKAVEAASAEGQFATRRSWISGLARLARTMRLTAGLPGAREAVNPWAQGKLA